MGGVAAAVLAAVVLGAACNPLNSTNSNAPTPAPKIGSPIVIGLPNAASGALAQEAALNKQGYDLWADWANRKGGILVQGVRHPVQLDYADDQSDPRVAAQLAEKMATQDGAQFFLGPYGTPSTATAAQVAEKHHLPFVSGNGAARSIFNQGYHYVFGVLAPPALDTHTFIDMEASLSPKPKTVAILTADDEFSLEVAQGTVDYSATKGIQVVYQQKYPAGSTNLYPLVQDVKAKNPDIVLNAGHLLEAIAVQKAALDLRLDPKLFVYAIGPAAPQFVQVLGPAAEFAFTASPWTAQAKYKAEYYLSTADYIAAYRKKYNTQQEPSFVVADATAAGLALEAAIEKADSLEADKVRDALANLDLNTFYGEIKFDDTGQNSFKPLLVEQIQNGQRLTVYPPEEATASPMYPMPTWESRFGAAPAAPPKGKLPKTGAPPQGG